METKRTSRVGQTGIYVAKHFRIFLHEKGWSFIVFGAIISWLVASVVGKKMFNTYDSTKSGFFAIVSAIIWIGIFNSIQTICKERSIIKYEHRTGLHISSYVISHVIYQAVICFIQTAVMLAIFMIYIDFPEDGLIFSSPIPEYFITIFLMLLASDVMGIAISSIVRTSNAAMTVMPFVLILQLIMSGVLFSLSGLTKKVAFFTISKWGMQALVSISDMNSLPLNITLEYPQINRVSTNPAYEATSEHILKVWAIFILFTAVFTLISIISLEFIDKDK